MSISLVSELELSLQSVLLDHTPLQLHCLDLLLWVNLTGRGGKGIKEREDGARGVGGRALFEGGDYLRDAYYLRKYSILSTYGNLQNSRGQLWERDLVPSPHNMFTLFDQRLTFTSTLLF